MKATVTNMADRRYYRAHSEAPPGSTRQWVTDSLHHAVDLQAMTEARHTGQPDATHLETLTGEEGSR